MRLPSFFVVLTVAVLGLKAPLWASSSIWWPEWNINSTENFGDAYDDKKLVPHPLSALFDANPRTTWVMNPKAMLEEMVFTDGDEKFFAKTKRGLFLSRESPWKSGASKSFWVSGLQIMNGDNSSARAFAASNRIRALRVTLLDGKKRHSSFLPLRDKMGWQSVWWPRQKAHSIAIEFAQVLDPRKPVCSSGLGLLDGTREIKWKMPQVVMFAQGKQGDVGPLLLNRRGQILDGIVGDTGNEEMWSRDGRFVAGLSGANYVWVADTRRGKIVRKIASAGDTDYKWIAPHRLQVTSLRPDKKRNWKPFHSKTYRF